MKSKLLIGLSVAVLFGAAEVTNTVDAGLSANVAMTSDYRFRGITQNNQSFAIQGGIDYENANGFHAGVWSSSVDFQVQAVDDASSELDIYAGYGGDFGKSGISWDVGFLHYNYPSADGALNYDFTEINATLSYEWLTLFYAHSSDYFAASGAADYINVAADFELDSGLSVGLSIGHQSVDDNAAWGTPDWNEYKAYVGKSHMGLDFELAFIDTDLSVNECFGGSDWCDSTATITVSKSF